MRKPGLKSLNQAAYRVIFWRDRNILAVNIRNYICLSRVSAENAGRTRRRALLLIAAYGFKQGSNELLARKLIPASPSIPVHISLLLPPRPRPTTQVISSSGWGWGLRMRNTSTEPVLRCEVRLFIISTSPPTTQFPLVCRAQQ